MPSDSWAKPLENVDKVPDKRKLIVTVIILFCTVRDSVEHGKDGKPNPRGRYSYHPGSGMALPFTFSVSLHIISACNGLAQVSI